MGRKDKGPDESLPERRKLRDRGREKVPPPDREAERRIYKRATGKDLPD